MGKNTKNSRSNVISGSGPSSAGDVGKQDGGQPLHVVSTASIDTASLESIRLFIRSELDSAVALLMKEISGLKQENNMLKNIISSQQAMLERQEINKRAKNIIVSGLFDNNSTSSDLESAKVLIEKVRTSLSNPPPCFEIDHVKRIGKSTDNRPRLLVISLSDKEHRSPILRNSKCLKLDKKYDNIFLSPDLPKLTRNENSRLHKAFKSAKAAGGSNVALRSGRLIVDGNMVDHFDIQNQLFR